MKGVVVVPIFFLSSGKAISVSGAVISWSDVTVPPVSRARSLLSSSFVPVQSAEKMSGLIG